MTERAKLTKDHPQIGEGMPMLSASLKPVRIGDVLFSGSANAELAGYRDEKPSTSVEVMAWRVIQVNYKSRYYRAQNTEGCETTVAFDTGCPRLKLYHDFDDLKDNLARYLRKEKEENKVAMENRKTLSKLIDDEIKGLKLQKPPAAPPKLKMDSASDK